MIKAELFVGDVVSGSQERIFNVEQFLFDGGDELCALQTYPNDGYADNGCQQSGGKHQCITA